jgi:ABC-2 type transport system ATP-binding protein
MSGPESQDAVMDVSGLSVSYAGRPALEDVSFRVPRGAVFVLLGRNGAGKSSLVRCALGLQKPSRGTARLFGADAWRTRAAAMALVGVVPEEPDAPPDMTAAELAAFCRRLYRRWDDAGVTQRLDRFGVPRDVPFGALSKGQKGAVMLALCLAPQPELLVLDDPTLGLDAVARKALYDELIGDLADRGATVFITTHDLAGVESLATHVAILRKTRLIVDEELDVLKARFRRIRCAKPAPATSPAWTPFVTVSERARDWGVEAVVSNYEDAVLEAFEAQSGARDVEVGTLSLEEVFVSLAGEEGGAA